MGDGEVVTVMVMPVVVVLVYNRFEGAASGFEMISPEIKMLLGLLIS